VRWPHQRFEAKIKKSNVGSKCWEWIGAKKDHGAGLFVVTSWPLKERRCISARKYSYQFYKGPVPPNCYVQTNCGNDKCVNPYHLILKTRSEVIRESIKAGRWTQPSVSNLPPVPRGEANWLCKVPDRVVQQIRKERSEGVKLSVLSFRYKTSISNVSSICLGKTRR
jgi:hypothetical protein